MFTYAPESDGVYISFHNKPRTYRTNVMALLCGRLSAQPCLRTLSVKNGDIPPERVCYGFRVLVFMHSFLWLGTFPCVVPFFFYSALRSCFLGKLNEYNSLPYYNRA